MKYQKLALIQEVYIGWGSYTVQRAVLFLWQKEALQTGGQLPMWDQ